LIIPDWSNAEIDSRKLTEYLLMMTHPKGRSKAIFFLKLGFGLFNWREFIPAIQAHAVSGVATRIEETEYGVLYKIEGAIKSPTRQGHIRSVWLIKWGSDNPRFITAYPLKGKNK